jgi:Lrp/AsnC family transcriptional regulator for asnA, asnC and gidA
MSAAAPELDELDHRIIDILSRDARVSNRRIGSLLGVNEGTVRARIRRLEETNSIRLTAVINTTQFGSLGTALIGVNTVRTEERAVAQKLVAMREIACVVLLLGRYDILAVGLFETAEALSDIANNRILALAGVTHVETSIAARTIKYDYRMAKITSAWKVGGRKNGRST